jgi:hypothetical protein
MHDLFISALRNPVAAMLRYRIHESANIKLHLAPCIQQYCTVHVNSFKNGRLNPAQHFFTAFAESCKDQNFFNWSCLRFFYM